MKIFGRRRGAELVKAEPIPARGRSFAVDADSGVLYGLPSLDDYIYRTGRISRAEALRVPAVKRARDLICGTIGQFTLVVRDDKGAPATLFSPNLFQQPEPGVASSVTWTNIVEDMLLFRCGWLRTQNKGWHGRPVDGRRLDAETVTVRQKMVQFPEGTAMVWPEIDGLIRFESPNGGLLDCSPAIRACIALERAAVNGVDGAPPIDYFTAADPNVDPFETDDDAQDFLDGWISARRQRRTAYIPTGLKYDSAGWDPEKMQLSEARNFAITEVARITGIDAEELSVSTTSRTYFNGQDRRRTFIEDVLGPYMTAIESRASMNDLTPYGYTVTFDTSSYLRLDDLAAAQSDSILVASKIITRDEARVKRNLEPLGEDTESEETAADVAAAHSSVAAIESARAAAQKGTSQ